MHIVYFHGQSQGLQPTALSSRALNNDHGQAEKTHILIKTRRAGDARKGSLSRRACLGHANHFLFSDVSRLEITKLLRSARGFLHGDLGDPELSGAQTSPARRAGGTGTLTEWRYPVRVLLTPGC